MDIAVNAVYFFIFTKYRLTFHRKLTVRNNDYLTPYVDHECRKKMKTLPCELVHAAVLADLSLDC